MVDLGAVWGSRYVLPHQRVFADMGGNLVASTAACAAP